MRNELGQSSLRRILRSLLIGGLLFGGGVSALLSGCGAAEACIDAKSCVDSTLSCSVECAGIVP